MEKPYHNFKTGNSTLDRSLDDYLMHGYQPGGFLIAVLSNDLFRAARCADHWNRDRIAHIAEEIQTVMPWNSYGDRQWVDEWIADKDGRRSAYAKQVEQQRVLDILSGRIKIEDSVENIPF